MDKTRMIKIAMLSLVGIFSIGVIVFGLQTGFGFGDLLTTEKPFVGEEKYEYSAKKADVSALEVRWLDGDIEIRRGEGKDLRIVETSEGELSSAQKVQLETTGERLILKWNERYLLQGLVPFSRQRKQLLIEIPKGMALDVIKVDARQAGVKIETQTAGEIELACESGGVMVTGITVADLAVKTGSGAVALTDVLCRNAVLVSDSGKIVGKAFSAESLTLNAISGAVTLDGNLGAVQGKSVSGGLSLVTGVMPTAVSLGSVSGELSLVLPENKGFLLQEADLSGAFSSSTFPLEKDKSEMFYKNSKATATVKLHTGDAAVRLEKGKDDPKAKSYTEFLKAKSEAAEAAAAKKAGKKAKS